MRVQDPDLSATLAARLKQLETGAGVRDAVAQLLAEIRADGDAALCRLTAQFDRAQLKPEGLRVPQAELSQAAEALCAKRRDAIEAAIASVRTFHERTVPEPWTAENLHGALVGERFYPLRRVGLYIPGGQVPLVSTVIMTAIPAVVAGCPEIAVCTPPRPDGSIDPSLLAALNLCGITEVYRLGGVQAIGALGYGTASVPAVDKIYGPGNAYVMEAKRQLFGTVGVDLLPGPSEVLVIADETAPAAWVAADLIAQAEHGTGKEKVYLMTIGQGIADAVEAALKGQIPQRQHAAAIRKVLDERAVVVEAETPEQVAALANQIAPEHMELVVSEALQQLLLEHITTAGAILLGPQTPTVLGDFAAGPSHTLPTDTTARFSGGIQTIDFMRRSSLVRYNAEANRRAWPIVEAFAEMEQLDGHGESLRLRLAEG